MKDLTKILEVQFHIHSSNVQKLNQIMKIIL